MLTRRLGLALTIALFGVITACGENGDGPTRALTVALRMEDDEDEYRYVAVGEVPRFEVGDEVTFTVENSGTLNHDLVIVDPDGRTVGSAAAVGPGGVLDLTVDLDAPGIYQLNCLVDNHLTEHNMQTLIQVFDR